MSAPQAKLEAKARAPQKLREGWRRQLLLWRPCDAAARTRPKEAPAARAAHGRRSSTTADSPALATMFLRQNGTRPTTNRKASGCTNSLFCNPKLCFTTPSGYYSELRFVSFSEKRRCKTANVFRLPGRC